MRPGGALRLVQVRRGDADPAPTGCLWNGTSGSISGVGAISLRDRIRVELTRSWRLQVGDALALGQVLVGGEPRFITRLPDSPRAGVEVRQGRIDLVADSRIEGGTRSLPATGWRLDFQSVRTHLHLPPGWDLLAVSGADNLPDSWLNRWTLLDLLLVLIIALAVARLWGWPWGMVALVATVLSWQEPGAPRMIWLNLLAVAAPSCVCCLRRRAGPPWPACGACCCSTSGSLLLLAVIAVLFLVEGVSTGLYPQLERPWALPAPPSAVMAPMVEESAEREEPRDDMQADVVMGLDQAMVGRKQARGKVAKAVPESLSQSLPTIDPDARVKTGPGVPTWGWKSLELTWNGPVPQDHRIDLWLLTPGWNLALAMARLVLVLVLGLKIAGLWEAVSRRAPAAVLLVAGLFGPSTPASAQAFPSPELLEALKTRLLEPPDCHPACADIPHLRLETTGDTLALVMTADADAAVALPVPRRHRRLGPERSHPVRRVLRGVAQGEGGSSVGSGAAWPLVTRAYRPPTFAGPDRAPASQADTTGRE